MEELIETLERLVPPSDFTKHTLTEVIERLAMAIEEQNKILSKK